MILSVMIDSREPTEYQTLTFGNVPTAVVALDAGDLLIATDDAAMLCIERKTPSDLLNTIREGRLLPQVARMREASRWAYLVVGGEMVRSPNGKVCTQNGHTMAETGWAWDAVQGALLTVQELGVSVVQCGEGTAQYEAAVMRLAARERGVAIVPPPRLPQVLSPGEAAIAALPGIGLERLAAVMRYAGSPAWALLALTEHSEKEHIPGIGEGTRRRVRAALGLDEDQELYILPTGAQIKEIRSNEH